VPLLAAGRLDPRLFDVTGLLADGYHARADLPLIVQSADRRAAAAVVRAAGGGPARDLPTINGVGVRVNLSTTATLWQSLTTGALRTAVRKVWLDGVVRLGIDVSVPLVGAPAAWAAGWTGGRVPVGVLDTGVDADHPDLAGVVAESADFTAAGDGVDRVGHGTHVASIIAGSGAVSGGRYRGMAPDVRLYSAKVCETTSCTESAVLAGMQWAARDRGLKVVNLSLGHADGPGSDLLEAAVGTLTARYGTLFVVAAGNDHARVWSPASADAALAVGASTEDDAVAGFSNRGPRTGDEVAKPDLVAPGVDITAARSGDARLPAPPGAGAYTTLSGTSPAAPHVTGAAAILAQQHPDWTPELLKAALMSSATPLERRTPDESGAGRLDVAHAVDSPVLATPASLSFDRAGARTVTYRNSGSAPITLALSASTDAFAAGESTLTVPARGEASVRVTARAGRDRRTGLLRAESGEVAVHTTLGSSAPAHALTVRFLDRAGAVSAAATGTAYGDDGTAWTIGGGPVRLPAGRYTLDAQVVEADGGITLLNRPRLDLTGDTTVQMDARLGRPVSIIRPAADARPVYAQIAATLPGGATSTVQDDTFAGLTTAQIGAGRPGQRTDIAASFAGPGTLYSLAWTEAGRFSTGFSRAVDASALVPVRAEFAASQPGSTGLITRFSAGGGHVSAVALPARRAEYFTPGRWSSLFTETSPAGTARIMTAGAVAPVDIWNTGVYGPAFPPPTPWRNVVGAGVANPAWSADAEHGGPPPGPVTVAGNRISAGGTTWTVPPGERAVQPLSAVRFEPRSATVLGFFVQHQVPGTATTSLALEVSYDDGKTWRTALHSRVGERGVAFLRPGEGAVSLRVTAGNSAGATVTQTMIRAFHR
jgi:subtilisin family serine protease